MTDAPGLIFTQRPSKHCAALGMRPDHRHMETQPRHTAAQVTLLEASFVFLPGLRRGENPSSEQHRQAPKCCCSFARSSSGVRSGSGAAERPVAAASERRSGVQQQRRSKSPPQPAAAASFRQHQRRAASGSSNREQPCTSSQIRLNYSKHRSAATILCLCEAEGGGWLCFRPKHSCRKLSSLSLHVGNTCAGD